MSSMINIVQVGILFTLLFLELLASNETHIANHLEIIENQRIIIEMLNRTGVNP